MVIDKIMYIFRAVKNTFIRSKIVQWSMRQSPCITPVKIMILSVVMICIGFLAMLFFPIIHYEAHFAILFAFTILIASGITCHSFSYHELMQTPSSIRIIALLMGTLAVYSSLFINNLDSVPLIFDPRILLSNLSNSYNFGIQFMDVQLTSHPLNKNIIYFGILMGYIFSALMMSRYAIIFKLLEKNKK